MWSLYVLIVAAASADDAYWACDGNAENCNNEAECSAAGTRTVYCCKGSDWGQKCYGRGDGWVEYDQYRVDDSECSGDKPAETCTPKECRGQAGSGPGGAPRLRRLAHRPQTAHASSLALLNAFHSSSLPHCHYRSKMSVRFIVVTSSET